MGRDWTGLGCDASVSWIGVPRPGAPELAKQAGHHFVYGLLRLERHVWIGGL
jgi:hypothetical protein